MTLLPVPPLRKQVLALPEGSTPQWVVKVATGGGRGELEYGDAGLGFYETVPTPCAVCPEPAVFRIGGRDVERGRNPLVSNHVDPASFACAGHLADRLQFITAHYNSYEGVWPQSSHGGEGRAFRVDVCLWAEPRPPGPLLGVME